MSQPAMSKAAQHKAVGQGLAVGLLALGITAITSNRQAVSSAFRHAWHDWPRRGKFPQVRTGLDREDIHNIIARSSGRQGSLVATWVSGKELVPTLEVDWPIEEAGAAVSDGDAGNDPVTHEQWVDLARRFAASLEPGERRSASAE